MKKATKRLTKRVRYRRNDATDKNTVVLTQGLRKDLLAIEFERVLKERQATIERLERDYAELQARGGREIVHWEKEVAVARCERDAAVKQADDALALAGVAPVKVDWRAVAEELQNVLAAVRLDYLTQASRAVSSRVVYRGD